MFEVRWKYSEYFATVRFQNINTVEFLSYVGGILGLFAGISVLSIFEIFYFVTLRWIVDGWRVLKEKKGKGGEGEALGGLEKVEVGKL